MSISELKSDYVVDIDGEVFYVPEDRECEFTLYDGNIIHRRLSVPEVLSVLRKNVN